MEMPARDRRLNVVALALFAHLLAALPAIPAWGQAAASPKTAGAAKGRTAAPAKQAGEAAKSAAPSAPEMTSADLDAFFDGFVPMQIQRDDIAGAVLVVVKDGKVVYGKGFGYADLEKKKPVSVDDTLFRPGSVSKLFTCTVVMQLVEQGKLDLDRDVNDYLDFKIRPKYGQPVTLRRIMTHTAGFEEVVRDLFISDAKKLKPLRQYLIENQPERMYAPGTVPAYSNYAMALAGYLVEHVSGEKFEDYVTSHIYKPLGMVHSAFDQPLPAEIAPLMSNGYGAASDGSKSFEVVQAVPAGSMATSGTDMARFMIAHLQEGRYGEAQMLEPETARLMHARAFAPDPKMPAMALAFFEETRNGHYMIGHGGDTQYFHSHMHLIPDANVGLFISFNSLGKGQANLRQMLWEKFTDRYFPNQSRPEPAFAGGAGDAAQVAGSYLGSRRADSSFVRAAALTSAASVTAQPDGTILFDVFKGFNGKPRRWREVAPMIFQDVNGQDRLFFHRDGNGRMTMFTFFGAFAFQRAAWYETQGFNLFLLFFTLAILALTLIFWPVAGLVRRHYKQPLTLSGGELRLRRLTRLVCALDLLVVILWTAIVTYAGSVIGRFNDSLNPWLYLAQILGILGAVGTIFVLLNALRSLFSSRWWWSKIYEVLVALACLGFVWIGYAWRMMHISARY